MDRRGDGIAGRRGDVSGLRRSGNIALSPWYGEASRLLEWLALVAMVPLTCWICGLYGAVRGLNLTVRTSRVARLLSVSALASASLLGTPPAQAVSPPQIDDKWLPKPVRPAPPWPTVQREVCATMTTGSAPDRLTDLLDLSRVWQLTRGAGQRVAVIDTGVSRHRLLPDVVPGGDYVSSGDGTQDCDAHGTLVAGIIAAAADADASAAWRPKRL